MPASPVTPPATLPRRLGSCLALAAGVLALGLGASAALAQSNSEYAAAKASGQGNGRSGHQKISLLFSIVLAASPARR